MSFRHTEALCLMLYRGEKTGQIEMLWNSRDGVTPYTIPSADGSETMRHYQFGLDVCARSFIPPIGLRVFVDMTREAAERYAVRNVGKRWDDPNHPMSDHFATREEALHELASSYFGDGHQPDVVVVVEALHRAFALDLRELLEAGRRGEVSFSERAK